MYLSLLCNVLFISSCLQDFLFVFGVIHFDHDLVFFALFFFNFIWGLLSFLNLKIYVFQHIWKNFVHYFFKYFFGPILILSSETPVVHVFDICIFDLALFFHKSLRLVHFLKTISDRSGFINPSTIDILDQIIFSVWEGFPVHCMVVSSIPGLYH